MFAPSGDTPVTAAFFRITNMTNRNTATDQSVDSVVVPAGDSLAMSPSSLDVIVPAKPGRQSGDLVAFTLHFERSGAVKTLAVVVRPGRTAHDAPAPIVVGRTVRRVPPGRCVLYHSPRDEWQTRVLCVPTGDGWSPDARMRPS